MSVDYSPIFESLYEASLDGSTWQSFCDGFTQVTGGPIMLFGHRIDINQSLGLI